MGLDSNFIDLVDAVSEDMSRAAVEKEPGGLMLAGFATAVQPSVHTC